MRKDEMLRERLFDGCLLIQVAKYQGPRILPYPVISDAGIHQFEDAASCTPLPQP